MMPDKNLRADYKKGTLKVLAVLENIGYHIVCILSCNNHVNRNKFCALCDSDLKPYITRPSNSSQQLNFLFDSVYFLKCIRNN